MNEVETAERIVGELQDKRDALIGRIKILTKQRQQVAYAAHNGDAKAKARLKEINMEALTNGAEIESIDAAIAEANARLDAARLDGVRAADRERAKQIQAAAAELLEAGSELGLAFEDAITQAVSVKAALTKLHGLGVSSPNDRQLQVLGALAFKTMLQATPFWSHDYDRLAPSQFQYFGPIVRDWHARLTREAEAMLGEKTKEVA